MDSKDQFDFWYAVNNTEVVVQPRQSLESFGTTSIHYHLVTELMDTTSQVRVRQGRIHAYRPEIILPEGSLESFLEGFDEEQATDYVEWLRSHEESLFILKYGFRIRKEQIKTEIIHDKLESVLNRIRDEIEGQDTLHALLRGVDEPWEVCLVKLMVEMVQQSAELNATDLRNDPDGSHHEINKAFEIAAKDASTIHDLAGILRKKNLFEHYEDRFFSLVRSKTQ